MTQGDLITLTTPADILAAIPALLGYTPENSTVVIALARRCVVATARVDAADTEETAARLAAAIGWQQAHSGAHVDAVIVAVVADPIQSGAALVGVDALRAEFVALDIVVAAALHTYALTAGTTFTDLDLLEDGVVPDTFATEVAAAMVLDGNVIHARREDLSARFAPGDEIPESLGRAAAAALGSDFLPVTFDELAAVTYARETPSADLISRVGLALGTGRVEVRDAFLSMAIYGTGDAADVFVRIAARVRGSARAHALTIAAFFLYQSGNGAAVNVAIEAVRATARDAAIGEPSLCELLTSAMRVGAPPALLNSVVDIITPEYVAEHIGNVQSFR